MAKSCRNQGICYDFLKGEGGSYVSPRVILNLVYAAGLPCVSAGSYSCDNNWVSSRGKDACHADSSDMRVFTCWVINSACCWLLKQIIPLIPQGEGGTRCILSEILSSWSSNFISHSKAPKALRLELLLQSGLEVASELDMTQVWHIRDPFQVYIRDCSMVSEYSLLLFCGDNLSVNLEKGVFVISIDDGWIRFSASSHEVGGLVKKTLCYFGLMFVFT